MNVFTRIRKVSCQGFNLGYFMWKLLSLPNLYWHYRPILRLAGVFVLLQMTLLMNKFAHPCYAPGTTPGPSQQRNSSLSQVFAYSPNYKTLCKPSRSTSRDYIHWMQPFEAGADRASKVRGGGRFQYYLVIKSHNSFATVREMKYHNTAVTKQWTTKCPYIANGVFRIL